MTPPPPLPPEIEFEYRPENLIVVPKRLDRPHPLIRRTRDMLKASKATNSTRGLLIAQGVLDIRVAPASLSRALRIVQALIGAIEKRGGTVSVYTERAGIAADLFGERVLFHLTERTKQGPPTTTYAKYDLVPTGVLSLEIGDWSRQVAVADTRTLRLEDRLNEFMVKLVEAVFEARRRRAERARREAEELERQRLAAIEAEERRLEEEKIAQLDTWIHDWRRARHIRAFAKAIRRRRAPVAEGGELANWLAWAEDYANSIDPLDGDRE